MITRRQIANDIRRLADDRRPLFVLNPELQRSVQKFASYGIKRVVLMLKDGSSFEASIAWDRHIVFVEGYGLPPFEPELVVGVPEIKPDEEREHQIELQFSADAKGWTAMLIPEASWNT
jgi:hypothetical protein